MVDRKNDIEKYLKGELTPAQMHALEKEALKDPFLAEALEGIQSLQPSELSEDLGTLQSALSRRVEEKKLNRWGWTARIAAGLLLLAVSGYLIFYTADNSDEKSSRNLALNKQEEPAPKPEPATETTTDDTKLKEEDASTTEDILTERRAESSTAQPAVTEQLQAQPSPREDVGPAEKVDGEEQTERKREQKVAPAAEEKITIADEAAPAERVEADKKRRDAGNDDLAEAADSKPAAGARANTSEYSFSVNRRVIKGKVTFSDDGTGLPGVNVMLKDSNEGTVTDAEGNYQIPVNSADAKLVFSFIGFASKEVEATADELNVQLDADVSELSEVVVIGYGESSAAFTPTVMELATPEGGRKAFKQYLEQNLKYPEQALKNEVEGKVTIQFTIDVTGQLSDFKVIRGIGHGCEEEVIRLIKSGPKWSPTKKDEAAVKDRARVRMRFSLPKK